MHGIESIRQPYGFGSFVSKAFKKVARPIKKVLKSPIGKMALLGGLGAYGANAGWFGGGPQSFMKSPGKWGKIMNFLGGSEATQNPLGPNLPFLGDKGFIAGKPNILMRGLNLAKKHPLITAGIVGGGATALAAGKGEEEIDADITMGGKGHEDYLKMRELWDWGGEEPMFSAAQGGRVPAQQGLYATPQYGQMMDTQEEIETGPAPDMGQQIQNEERTAQTEQAELIMLIKKLAAMGVPMEQLRGRTKEELVEFMVSISKQGNQETAMVEEEATYNTGGRVGLRAGGDDSILIDESSEVIKGGQDGDVEIQQQMEMASGPYEGTSADADEHSMRLFGKPYHQLNPAELEEFQMEMERLGSKFMNQGGIARTGYAMGTEHPVIPSKDGNQLDMRETGGYQPHGAQEKKDDVRALLAQGEFVMTSDAVKGMGGGNRELGAKKMYNLMHNMEAMA